MKYRISFFLFLLALLQGGYSQNLLDWERIDRLTDSLPPEIQIYKASGTIGGDTLTAYYSKTRLQTGNLALYPVFSKTNKKPDKYIQESSDDILLLTNGGYFGTNVSYSLVLNNYITHAPNARAVNRTYNSQNYLYYPTRAAFGISANLVAEAGYVYTFQNDNQTYIYPEASPITTDSLPLPQPSPEFPPGGKPWKVSEAIGGGPLLIRDSIINTNYAVEFFSPDFTSNPHPRTAIGMTGEGDLINLVIDGRQSHSKGVSLEVLSGILLEIGCVQAINLDGGGSSCFFMKDSLLNKPSDGSTRFIPSVVAVKSTSRYNASDSMDFEFLSDPSDSLGDSYFGLEKTFLFPQGKAGMFLIHNIIPAEYRLEYAVPGPGETDFSGKAEFILHRGIGQRDTIMADLRNLPDAQFINLGRYQIGLSDSLYINNHSEADLLPVSGLRLIRTGTGLPTVELDPADYSGTHFNNEHVKFSVIAGSQNNSRLINGFMVYEQIGGQFIKIIEKDFIPVSSYEDSVDYLITVPADQIKLYSVIYDELGDSSFAVYTIKIDNSPPSIGLGRNSVLTGGAGDTLKFVLKLFSANHPLKDLFIYKNPDSENLQLEHLLPDPIGDTIIYTYPIEAGDYPGIIFRFDLIDTAGYLGTRVINTYVTSLQSPVQQDHSWYYNPGDNSLVCKTPGIAGQGLKDFILHDIHGRVHFRKRIHDEKVHFIYLPELEEGIYLAKLVKENFILTMKLVILR